MGGWLLPQEKSYFSLRLPGGWWLFALDLALVEDLDMSQYRYFARIAEERMGPGDAAIIVSHAPYWLINWFWGRHEGKVSFFLVFYLFFSLKLVTQSVLL